MGTERSRTDNAALNVFWSIVLYIIYYVVQFLSRTIFIRCLGNQYLSIAGLFSNIITLLSFTELGLGSASVFALYKPIANKDFNEINRYLALFSKLYKYIASVTFVIGILVIPFFPYIIGDNSLDFSDTYIVLVYCIFLLDTISSYFLITKRLFMIADQKNYIVSIVDQICNVLFTIIRCVLIALYSNYLIFLILQLFQTFFSNYAIHRYVKKKYPLITNINATGSLQPEQIKDVKNNLFSIFFYKIGSIILNGTDNILISAMDGILTVGVYSNYVLVIHSIQILTMKLFEGISASIGNLTVTEDKQSQMKVFYQLDSFCSFVFSFVSICLMVLLNSLIKIWIGEDFILSQSVVLPSVLALYTLGSNQVLSMYRSSLGLFKQAKFFPILAAIFNIIFSVVFYKLIGLAGIFWATVMSRILFFSAADINLVFFRGFNTTSIFYWGKYFLRFVCVFAIYLMVSTIIGRFDIVRFRDLVISTLICILVSLSGLTLCYMLDRNFILFIGRIKSLIMSKTSKK